MLSIHEEHKRRFLKTVLGILVVIFVVAGLRSVSNTAKADKEEPQPAVTIEPVPAPVGPVKEPPTFDGAAALVRELRSDRDLFASSARMRWPLASITKLMTAVVAFEKLPADKQITMTESAMAIEGVAGGFKVGERYSVNDLVKAMLAVSSNDAAEALAQAYDESQMGTAQFDAALSKTSLFIIAMNEKAAELGMADTLFGDATGLSMVSQSTAHDLQVLARYLMDTYPGALETTRRKESTITELSSGTSRVLKNINQFSGRADFLGGKTGRTDESGDNLISLFSHEDKIYFIVVFGTQDRFKETQALLNWTIND